MITKEQIDFFSYNQTIYPIQLDFLPRLLVRTTRLLKTNTTAYKLDFFEKMLNYMRAIGLFVLSKNQHVLPTKLDLSETINANSKDRISQSLIEFLFHFGIIVERDSKLAVNGDYTQLLEENRIGNLIKNKGDLSEASLTAKEKTIINDFRFVYDLVQKYNNPDFAFKYISGRKTWVWENLVSERKLDYEVRLSETLYNLVDLNIPQKIKSPFNEDYYTESGQNAFKNFTRFRFVDYIKCITGNNENINVFDLGCGYGNYVEAIRSSFPKATVTGIEKNEDVFSETVEKFKESKNIKIINDDFFRFDSQEKYDVILMNYVLFYFNLDEKKKIIEKAKSMLTEGGAIVLCQYFSGIEYLKQDMARKQNDFSVAKKIEMYYSDKVLYANTLWNDSVDTFAEAVKWNEFKDIVSGAGLHIASMTHADPFYYSLFIGLKKNL